MLKTLAAKSKKILKNDTGDESIYCQDSVTLQPDLMDSRTSTEDTQYLKVVSESEGEYINVQKNEDVQNVHNDEDDYTFVIEKTGLVDTDRIQQHEPEGDRIINISFFHEELHRTFDNHAQGIECQFKNWRLVNTRRCGFKTQFFYKCDMCHYEADFWSHPIDGKTLDVNTAITAGTITTGIGYGQMEEMFAAANIPCMSEKKYIQHRDIVLDEYEKTAFENMKMAGEVEKQLAVERNEVINGIPYITVVADGSWAKRSYGTAYDSLSGVGAIIGYRTRKVLYVGIRNKFCIKCYIAERKGLVAKDHKCYKNFDRNVSSTRMESDAIAEGFKCSIEMHGLIFKTLIADGDSNVYHSIINNDPYRELMITVQKVECINHLLRNLCKKLKIAAETIEPKWRRNRDFIKLRNIVKKIF